MLLAAAALFPQHMVAVRPDGRVFLVQSDDAAPDATGSDHVWVWSENSAPRPVKPEKLSAALPKDARRLAISVPSKRDGRPRAGTVIAAPVAMWEEVPENLLPRWTVPKSAVVKVPVDGKRPWRVRFVGKSEGTWWIDLPPGRNRAKLVPFACGSVKTVVRGSSGGPVGDASVRLFHVAATGSDLQLLARGQSDGKGRVAFPSLPDREEVLVVATHQESGPLAVRCRIADMPRSLRLPAGAKVAGRCADEQGHPLAGAGVHVETWLSASTPIPWSMDATAAASGAWSMSGLPKGRALVVARAAGRVPVRREVTLGDKPADLGTLRLVPGVAVSVRVVDDVGSPISGAKLKVNDLAAGTTGPDGRSRLAAVPAVGTVRLQASAFRHLAGERRLSPPLPDTVSIELVRAFTLTGRLLDSEGTPVDKGTARVETASGHLTMANLDDGGRFTFELNPGVGFTLTARSPTTSPVKVAVAPGAPGEQRHLDDLQAPPGLAVTGTVVSRADGAPVAGARVWTPRPSESGPLMAWFQGDVLETTTGDDGSFVLTGAPVAPMVLRVDAPGYARTRTSVTPKEGEAEIDAGEVEVSAGTTLRIVPEAKAEGATARVDTGGQGSDVDVLTATVRDGEAVVRHVPAGEVRISVRDGRSLLCEKTLDVPEGERELEVECRDKRMTVRGEVLVGERAADGGTLMWMGGAAEGPSIINTSVTPGGLRQQSTLGGQQTTVIAEVEHDGGFSSDELRPGAWQASYLTSRGSATEPKRVTLPDVSEYTVTLHYAGIALSGHVVDTEGVAVAGCRVRELNSGTFAPAGDNGEFRFTGLAPGTARLVARCSRRSSAVEEVTLSLDHQPEPVELVVEEDRQGAVEVTVAGPEGSPASGAVVFVQSNDGRMMIASTDISGRATVRFDRPYPTRVHAASLASGVWALGSWLAWDETGSGVSLEAGDAGGIEVTSKTAAGAVSVTSSGGWNLSTLLGRIGAPPVVSPDLPSVVNGLPSGPYQVAVGDAGLAVTVSAGDIAPAELP